MPEGSLSYHLNTLVTELDTEKKEVKTSTGNTVQYDILVLATGSDAVLPRHTPGHDAKGVFVYRTIEDLQRLIEFASTRKGTTGVTVGGGLLGLEAAKAMMDLEDFGQVKLIERNRWVLSRQLDGDAGGMVLEQVRALGLDVMLSKRVGKIDVDGEGFVKGVVFEDGEAMECSTICFAVSCGAPSIRQNADGYRSASELATSLRGGPASSAPIEGAVLSLHRAFLPLWTTCMRLVSAQAGKTKLSDSSHRALRWRMCLPSTSHRRKHMRRESSSVQI